jgi:DNA polymerase III subunit delta
MPALSPTALRTQLTSGTVGPLYVLVGADGVERSAVADGFTALVEEELQPFNVERRHGADTSPDALIDAANVFPLMARWRVVIVLEAERMLTPRRESREADEQAARLERFIEAPSPSSVIVFECGALDMRRRVSKLLLRAAHVVDCGSIEDEAAAERWVRARAERENTPLEPAAVRALVERAGLDVGRLRAALERVALYGMGQKTISAADVAESVSAGPETQADFGIAKAIWRDDPREALRELTRALDAGAAPFLVLGQLRAAAERLASGRVSAGMAAVLRTDLALKSSGGEASVLLERLVVELCSAPGRGARPRVTAR